MKPQSAIQKGKELENFVCDKLKEKQLDNYASRSAGSGSGNREKADINASLMFLGRTAGIECKNWATPHIKEWWEQTKKLEKIGREPILVYKLKNERYEDSKAVVYLDTLLELIKSSNARIDDLGEVRYSNQQTPKDYQMKSLRLKLKEIIAIIDKLS